MAKPRTPKKQAKKDEVPPQSPLQDPKRCHELLGIVGPYDPPALPVPTTNHVTFWDPGCSIQTIAKKQPTLLYRPDWLEGERFARDSDSWKWRQIDMTVSGLGEPFDTPMLSRDDMPLARELVSYLVLHFLATGERLDIPRLRCKDVMPSGRRVVVGPFRDCGLEIANVSDRWASPGIGFCTIATPLVRKT
jgi:hypothetical protein